jgi:tetratricopeptide (TPR) repeat protein
MRQRLLALAHARLKRFEADPDPATVLGQEAVAELTALLSTAPDLVTDLEVAHAAGWLHWCRYLVLRAGDDYHQDLASAMTLFMPVYRVNPGAVPDLARGYFAKRAVPVDSRPMTDRFVTLAREALRTGDRTDLDVAIDAGRQALAAFPADDSRRAAILSTLGAALGARFQRTGDQADLDAAIDLLNQAVAASTVGHPDHAGYLSNLGSALGIRFVRTGDQIDLEAAIEAGRQAVAATPVGHPGRPGYLSNLGNHLAIRSDRTGNQHDLDAATDLHRQAIAASPADHPDHARHLSSLSSDLRAQFERTGNQGDLDTAIDLLDQAVAASMTGHPDRALYLFNHSDVLLTRFNRTGEQADLDAAIEAGRLALTATPADDVERVRRLSMLGAALRSRAELTGDRADLDAAIDLHQQAVMASQDIHGSPAWCVVPLGNALRFRAELTGNQADLDAAIDLYRQAAAGPANDISRAMGLSSLSEALRSRSQQSGSQADMEAAIDAGQQAVAATPAGHPDRAKMLVNLGNVLDARFAQTRDPEQLGAAISVYRQGVAATPADHPDRAKMLANLGKSLDSRFQQTGDPADLDAAIDTFRQAVAVTAAPPLVRSAAARSWGRAAASGQRWHEAVAGFAAAAELLQLIAPRGLTRTDQEHLLEELGSLGADAAASCVRAGLTDRAVELFEQCRGVMLSRALDTRADLAELTGRHPGLAARFTALRDDLDWAEDAVVSPMALAEKDGPAQDTRAEALSQGAERRRAVAGEFDRLIAEIRQLPGFAGFLRPPPIAELLAAAAEGPAVVVAVSRFGSCALILTATGVLDPVPLPGLTPQAVTDQVLAFLHALDDAQSPGANLSHRADAEQRLSDTLGWLWDALAGPVLDQMGVTSAPVDGQPWPRLWWCVAGLLSLLPLHAAGYHGSQADAVIDRAISSYTPTLRALIYSRRSGTVNDEDSCPGPGEQIVLVAMPHTPGAADLPGAYREAALLQQRFPGQVTLLAGIQASHDAVLAALPSRRWAHFACHGFSDQGDPSASCLLLTDYRERPLTAADVARLRLDAELAFLSACSTARPGIVLADEAIHLASAFQLAGYRHVVATLWPVGDQNAVAFAADVYTALTVAGEADIAGAVHAAVRRRGRRVGRERPSVWASHIHVGR